MTVAPNQAFALVDSPPAIPPVVGLIPSLTGTPFLIDVEGEAAYGAEEPQRWEGGIQYNPEQMCEALGVFDPCGSDPIDLPANPNWVVGMPYIVAAGDTCSTFGWSGRDYVGRARRALTASESASIAHELWTGAKAQAAGWPNAYLASSGATVLGTGAVTPANALAMLEQGLADHSTGAPGMIHCTRELGAALSELGNTFRSINGLILTYMGTIICPDAGYPGTGPDGQAPADGSSWAYATLMPTVRRGEMRVTPGSYEEAIDRLSNNLTFRTERLALATFDPCAHLAVQVNLPLA